MAHVQYMAPGAIPIFILRLLDVKTIIATVHTAADIYSRTGLWLVRVLQIVKNVSDENLALLYNGASVLFFPSMYEGFGLPLLESMACGTPVVTCRNSSLEEIAGNCATYLDEPIENNLMEVMKNINAGLFNVEMKTVSGIQRAAQFTWDKCAKQTAMIYQRCLYYK